MAAPRNTIPHVVRGQSLIGVIGDNRLQVQHVLAPPTVRPDLFEVSKLAGEIKSTGDILIADKNEIYHISPEKEITRSQRVLACGHQTELLMAMTNIIYEMIDSPSDMIEMIMRVLNLDYEAFSLQPLPL